MSTPDNSGLAGAVVPLVLFSAGPWRLAIEASQVRSSRQVPAGMARGKAQETDQKMEPETERKWVETLVNLPVPADPAWLRQALILKLPGGDQEVLVGRPVDLTEIPASEIHPLPPLLAARIGLRGGKALALPGGGDAILILNPSSW